MGAVGGTLTLDGSLTNNGLVSAGLGGTVLVNRGLASNAGKIQLAGGAFDNNGKAIGKTEKAVRDADSTIRKNQEIIFKRIEASETAQIKAYKHIVSFLDAKGKTGLLDDINKVYEREKERRGL